MTTPKPVPSKPLTFTPPQHLKGETQSSELPFVEENTELKVVSGRERKPKNKNKGARPDIVIIDEVFHDGTVELVLGSTNKPEKPEVKKPFVLNPHLTQRPFHDDRLMQLKSRLQRPSFKNR